MLSGQPGVKVETYRPALTLALAAAFALAAFSLRRNG